VRSVSCEIKARNRRCSCPTERFRNAEIARKARAWRQRWVFQHPVRFQSAGADLSRFKKVQLIADNPKAHTLLDVCVRHPDVRRLKPKLNCSRCVKCAATLLMLEAIGKIDLFEAVFDLDCYRAKRTKLMKKVAKRAQDVGRQSEQDAIRLAQSCGLYTARPRSLPKKFARHVARKLIRLDTR